MAERTMQQKQRAAAKRGNRSSANTVGGKGPGGATARRNRYTDKKGAPKSMAVVTNERGVPVVAYSDGESSKGQARPSRVRNQLRRKRSKAMTKSLELSGVNIPGVAAPDTKVIGRNVDQRTGKAKKSNKRATKMRDNADRSRNNIGR